MASDSLAFYSPTSRKDVVDMPLDVLTFLKKRRVKFAGRDENVPIYAPPPRNRDGSSSSRGISYSNIRGRHYEEIPERVLRHCSKDVEVEMPVQNQTRNSKEEAERIAVKALRMLLGPGDYEVRSRRYIINTWTTPIKVEYEDEKGKIRAMYVKRPDPNRIIGKWMYDIISGIEPRAYFFNRAVFVEEGIPGFTLSKVHEKGIAERDLLGSREYRMSLVRASAHASFLELGDVINPMNRIVNGFTTVLFDFNVMFWGPSLHDGKPTNNALLSYYESMWSGEFKWFKPKYAREIIVDERKKITQRVGDNYNKFFEMVRAMEDVKDAISDMTFRQRAQAHYKRDSLESLFHEKLGF